MTEKNEYIDQYEVFQKICMQYIPYPRFAKMLACEFSTFYYTIFVWRKQAVPQGMYSSYKESGSVSMMSAFIGLIILETSVVHIFLVNWKPMLAWILFAISLYSLFFFIGHIKMLKRRFSEIREDSVILKFGFLGNMNISLSEIQSIELTEQKQENSNLKIEYMGGDIEAFNTIIHFKSPQILQKVYGFESSCDAIAIYIDQKMEFSEELQRTIHI